MSQETSAPRTDDTGPDHDDNGEPRPPTAAAQPATPARAVPLERLLSVVVLNPAQAAMVAARLLEGAHRGPTGNGTLPSGTALWTVAVTTSGDVEVSRDRTGEGLAVDELLGLLGRNARRLPTHPRPEQLALLRRLEETAARPRPEPDARALELEGALVEALGPEAVRRLPGELAALVAAFTRMTPSAAPARALAPAPAPAEPVRRPVAPPRAVPTRSGPARPWHRRALGHRRPRTHRVAVLALLLAAVLAGSGYVALRGPDGATDGSTDGATDRTQDATPGRDDRPGGSSTPTTSGSAGQGQARSGPRQAAGSLAARQAGPVTGVDLLRDGACVPGTSCPVTVTVRLQPSDTARTVTWRTGAARWCRRGASWSPPVTVVAQPGWTRVFSSTSVPVPRGPSRALVALTSAPARAQSAPVPATGSPRRC